MEYQRRTDLLEGRIVWVIDMENDFQDRLTLLISKVSEAILPETPGNHIGEGGCMEDFTQKQSGVWFIINGGFSHYRKSFYDWPHQAFNVGDPVGIVKIREHYYEDFRDAENYGFFVQEEKREPWKIIRYPDLKKTEKYILGCTPLLIFEGELQALPVDKMQRLEEGKITPPSILAHGLERHPRTAIGIKDDRLYFVIVEGDDTSGGCNLEELQKVGVALELEYFMNLDGGGSSQFRLWQDDRYIKNFVAPKDEDRVLGHVIVLFDEDLKSGQSYIVER